MKKFMLAGACALVSLPLLATPLSPLPRSGRTAQLVNVRRVAPRRGPMALDPLKNIGINVDVIGRLNGAGGILYKTSLDVSNNTSDATQVDFFALLKDQSAATGFEEFEIDGSIVNAGIASSGGVLADFSVVHFDDFIDALQKAGGMTTQEEADGVIGSVVLLFHGFTAAGQGSAEARFYSTVSSGNGSFSGGTIGVSVNGHEFTNAEPSSVVGIVRDTLGEANTPQIYTNLFICNEGYVSGDFLVGDSITIRLTGYSNSTGLITGTYTYPQTITIGQVAIIGDLFTKLSANPNTDDSLLVFVDIISGTSAISGLSAKNDNLTKDPSAAQLRPAVF